MLGSLPDADDAVQETWIRLARTDVDAVENVDAWLTTVVSRVCLNALRSRQVRTADSLHHLPDPVVSSADGADPEQEALLADSVGMALLVVLETLGPAERLSFVLHDVLAVPFDEIAALLGRSTDSARQLASRARRRVRASAPSMDTGLPAQRAVVEAFFSAARSGDFARLVDLLHPDVTLRADFGGGVQQTRGSGDVASQALSFSTAGRTPHPVTVNGGAGTVLVEHGRPVSVMAFAVSDGRVHSIDVLGDRGRLASLQLARFVG
jgi:RNA polymerase sigma factor (sigma-70 family)